jgi:hypothetical protein
MSAWLGLWPPRRAVWIPVVVVIVALAVVGVVVLERSGEQRSQAQEAAAPALTAQRAEALGADLASGDAARVRDAIAMPAGQSVDPGAAAALAKLRVRVDASTFAANGPRTATVSIAVTDASGTETRRLCALLYTADGWQLVDTFGNDAPAAWPLRLPAGLYARSMVTGADGMAWLQATRTPPATRGYEGRQESGAGAVLLAHADGSVTTAQELPELVRVEAAPAGPRRFLYSPTLSFGDCAHPGPVSLVDADGRRTETDTSVLRRNNADVFLQDAAWAPDGQLYATLASSVCDPSGGAPQVNPSLWRLDGNRWVSAGSGRADVVRAYAAGTRMVVADEVLWLERTGQRTQVATEVYAADAPPN